MNTALPTRDLYLDFLRGSAIFLVVTGHYLQGSSPNFDDNFWFRLIYSFHMPLFVFISGLAASIGLAKELSRPRAGLCRTACTTAMEIFHKAGRLLVPFFAWGLFAYSVDANDGMLSPAEYLWSLAKRPDNGLWFLPMLFVCYLFLGVAQFIYFALEKFCGKEFQMALLMVVIALTCGMPFAAPDWFVLHQAKLYFPFFCVGMICGIHKIYRLPGLLHEMPFIVFICLFPFWNRTQPADVIIQGWSAFHIPQPKLLFFALVACSGLYVFLRLAKGLYVMASQQIVSIVAMCGRRTLDIYALHLFFIDYFANVFSIIFAIAASLCVSAIMRKSTLIGLIFLGEWPKNRTALNATV